MRATRTMIRHRQDTVNGKGGQKMKKLLWVRNGKGNHDMKKFFAAFFAFVLGVFSLLASGIFCTCPVFGDDTNMGITKCKFPGELSDIRVELKLPHAQ